MENGYKKRWFLPGGVIGVFCAPLITLPAHFLTILRLFTSTFHVHGSFRQPLLTS